MILVLRVRGRVNISKKVEDTLDMLGLKRTNWAVVVPDSDKYTGMIKKVKDYIAWGKISEDFFKELVKKRGEAKRELKDKEIADLFAGKVTFKDIGLNKSFRLHPPRKGYIHKKKQKSIGGVLGKWEDVTELVGRML